MIKHIHDLPKMGLPQGKDKSLSIQKSTVENSNAQKKFQNSCSRGWERRTQRKLREDKRDSKGQTSQCLPLTNRAKLVNCVEVDRIF